MSDKGPPPAYQTDASAPLEQTNEPPPKYETAGGYQQAGYPPQGSYPSQGYQSMGQPLITTQPVVIQQQILRYGPDPQFITCVNCGAQVTTKIETEPGAITWLASGLICLVGCWLGCCLIPFCIKDLQDIKHTCPNCQRQVGTYRVI